MKNKFIDYGKLFGDLNFKEGDSARSVYSPAAYLADLLQLIEEYFDTEDSNWQEKGFFARRPDAKEIKLDKAQTFDTLPYLTIVNELLEKEITKKAKNTEEGYQEVPYKEVLNKISYPLNLPFNLDFKTAVHLLKQLEVEWAEILNAFSKQEIYGEEDNEGLFKATEFMGWSDEDFISFYTTVEEADFLTHYNIPAKYYLVPGYDAAATEQPTPLQALQYLEVFLKCTGISEKELREIVYQDLSQRNLEDANSEAKMAYQFWVNKGTGKGYPQIDDIENKLVWRNADDPNFTGEVPFKWFEKVSRFIKIKQKSDISYAELDHILRYFPPLMPQKNVVAFIPVIKSLSKITGLPIEDVMVFAFSISMLGHGDGDTPEDQFNRIYNSKSSSLYKKYVSPGADYQAPYQFEGYASLNKEEDILLESSEDCRNHILHALKIKEKDFKLLVEQMREKVPLLDGQTAFFKKGADLKSLTILYQIKLLSKICELSIPDLLTLFDIIATDPTLRDHNFFDIFALTEPKEGEAYYDYKSPFKIIFNEERFENLWLLQTSFALSSWMRENEVSVQELRFWVSGEEKDKKATEKAEKEKLAFLNNLLTEYKPYFLQEAQFISQRFNARDAKLILDTVQNPDYDIVSPKDDRLVLSTPADIKDAAYDAIIDLEMVNAEEFMNLQLEEKMIDKIIKNLIAKGYLSSDYHIVEEIFPEDAAQFSIDFDFAPQKAAVFGIIQQQVTEGLIELEEKDIEISLDALSEMSAYVYKSDLAGLELSEAQIDALYDNLIFNQIIQEDGSLVSPFIFAFEDGLDSFEVNADLETYAGQIHEQLAKSMKEFEKEDLFVTEDIFAATDLAPHEIKELIDNLVFNGYLTEKHKVVDKAGILVLQPNQFLLALVFYPKRKAILKALQDHVAAFKDKYFSLNNTVVQAIANKIVADRAFNALKKEYFPEGPVKPSYHAFFLDEANKPDFYIDPYFDAPASDTIFDTITKVIQSSSPYLLDDLTLEDIGFNAEEMAVLRERLIEKGHITDYHAMPEDQLSYFVNINNVVGFTVEGFEDYNRDIFVALHLIAKAMDEAMHEIVDTLKTLAKNQNDVLFLLFQEHFGLSADLIELIFKELYAEDDNLAHQIILPLISSVIEKEEQIKEVQDSEFNMAYLRMRQLLSLFNKLEFDPRAAKVLMTDQDLVQKFSEKFTLPKGITTIDALLETNKNTYLVFSGTKFIEYSGVDYKMKEEPQRLSALSSLLDATQPINAAYQDESGDEWIIQGELAIVREVGKDTWEKKERKWGLIENDFNEPKEVEFSFVDEKGRLFVFTGDQYARYTNGLPNMDDGYPKDIAGNWEKEDVEKSLPADIVGSKGSSVLAKSGKRYIFKKNKYSSSDDYTKFADVNTFWGKVKNNFVNIDHIDAAYFKDSKAFIISGDQVVSFTNSVETEELQVDPGSPKSFENIRPDWLENLGGKVHAAYTNFNGTTHYFGKEKYISISATTVGSAVAINERWARVNNNIANTGQIDAALDGLDGKIYLFSGSHYYRYSTDDYSKVDEGYPRPITEDWGGLEAVDAATILDGKTYLFGRKGEVATHLRYSTRDYNNPDKDYSVKDAENWWNLPFALVQTGFNTPDAVFQDFDGDTHLFLGDKFVTFDRLHRWWSEPQPLLTKWDSIPFNKIDAAFIGKDGNTYLFSGDQFVRYSDKNYNRIDADFPKMTADFFGKVDNTIIDENVVDAALCLISRTEDEDKKITTHQHIYLFAGKQYVRYTVPEGTQDVPHFIDVGYPKLIARDLKEEPRFKGLNIDFDKGIDGAMADERNVYIFQGKQMHVYSDALYKTYTGRIQVNNAPITPDLLLQENGRVYSYFQNNWRWLGALEHKHVAIQDARPDLADHIPADFAEGLEMVLQGTDGNTYLFKGVNCYNVALEKSYRTKDAWGVSHNNFLMENEVDAGFLGVDGKVYLFSNEQFISYTIKDEGGTKTIPFLADANPGSVKETWGGLNHVYISYVNDGKTYLLEEPDANGKFRYVCYSSEEKDYKKPDDGFPKTADFSFWQIPEEFVADGFKRVTAVHVEDDNLYLFNGNTFIQYNSTLNQWTPPMPVSRIWENLPIGKTNLNVADFNDVKTLISGPNKELIFFSDHAYVVLKDDQVDDIKPIKNRWGIMHSEFISDTSKIDAALVTKEGQTFLFSGENYIRYSTDDYDIVDSGYPKPIVEHLKKEKGFENLPEDFDDKIKANGKIDAIMQNGRHQILFLGNDMHIVSTTATAQRSIDFLGKLRNNIQANNVVDAAYTTEEGEIFLFSGDQIYRYSKEDLSYVDEGYPKRLKDEITLPKEFQKGIDGVIQTPNGAILTKGDKFVKLGLDGVEGEPQNISKTLGGKDKVFGQGPGHIDAAFLSPNGYFYVFQGGQYIRYQDSDSEFIDDGYPRPIRDDWGDMALAFEKGIDGAFVLDGVTYFTQGENYIRYSDDSYQEMDPIYPQKIRDRFGDWNDIHLGDLSIATKFKALIKKSGSKSDSLMDFFDPEAPDRDDSFELLGKTFDWLVDEVKWLKRKNAFLKGTSHFERHMDLELLIRMDEIFSLCERLNRKPSAVYSKLWLRLYEPSQPYPRSFSDVAETLSEILSSKKNKTEWKELETKINDYLNDLKRNAMLPFVIATDPDVENARDLLGKLLIDVEMGVEAKTSRIKELLAAAQLFMHRYFVQIEDFKIQKEDEEAAKAELREQWRWLKNYRVWEANRKVFLYPENYLRPELRSFRTPAFDTFSNELLQGDMNDDTISQIYKKYLDEYTEVSRLTIAGGFVYDSLESVEPGEEKDKELVLFGRTKTDPRRYYYRTATFIEKDDSAVWNPWLEVNIKIDADRVYPVYAFGRIFVFWWVLDQEAIEPEKGSVNVRKSGNKQSASSGAKNMRSVIRIYYSFYNLNKEWAAPQLMKTSIFEDGNVTEEFMKQWGEIFGEEPPEDYDVSIYKDDIELFVQKRDSLDKADHENIYVACAYKAKSFSWNIKYQPSNIFSHDIKDMFKLEWVEFPSPRTKAYQLTPELYTIPTSEKTFDRAGSELLKQHFDEFSHNRRISNKRIVKLSNAASSSDTQWLSFDHKGGSFLLRPDKNAASKPIEPEDDLNLPDSVDWNRISAAFHFENKNHFFSGDQYVKQDESSSRPIKEVWGKASQPSGVGPQIASAWFRDGKAYLVSGQQKYSYDSQSYGKPNNTKESLSGKVPTAAFYNTSNETFYQFFGDKSYDKNGSSGSTTADWGKRTVITKEGHPGWTLQVGDDTLVFIGSRFYKPTTYQYFRVATSQLGQAIQPTWKKPLLKNIAEELGIAGNAHEGVNDKLNSVVVSVYQNTDGTGRILVEGHLEHFAIELIKKDGKIIMKKSTSGDPKDIRTMYVHSSKVIGFSTNGKIYLDKVEKATASRALSALIPAAGKYYVLSGDRYKDIPILGSETAEQLIARLAAITWEEEFTADTPMTADLGPVLNINPWQYASTTSTSVVETNISRTGIVDAAWYKDGKTYLTNGDEYIRYSGNNYASFDEGYPRKLSTNNEGIPNWSKVDAAFTGADQKTYFFNNAKNIWVNSDDTDVDHQAITEWFMEMISFELDRVDAAFAIEDDIYLVKSNVIYKHTKTNSGFAVAPGFPITIDRHITAACVLDGYVYLFSFDQFKRLAVETADFSDPEQYRNRWGSTSSGLANIDKEFLPEFDAALHDFNAKKIYIYKDNRMIAYNDDDNDERIKTNEDAGTKYVLTRLTSGTGYKLNTTLFAGGLDDFLSLDTQFVDETPAFEIGPEEGNKKVDRPNVITIRHGSKDRIITPVSSHLDFHSSNGLYYWEMFYYAPLLIAQTYNNLQKFEEAKRWYEFVFNPTQIGEYWRFIPFLNVDVASIDESIRSSIDQLKELNQSRKPEGSNTEVEAKMQAMTVQIQAIENAFTAKRTGTDDDDKPVPRDGIFEFLHKVQEAIEEDLVSTIPIPSYQSIQDLSDVRGIIEALDPNSKNQNFNNIAEREKDQLLEITFILERLEDRIKNLTNMEAELRTYREDPFDPHAIARIRKESYRKSVVMRYIDNLLDWGDMLFTQYTMESINEARMHYILAYDLLGQKPENVGSMLLTETKKYKDLNDLDKEDRTELDIKAVTKPPSGRYFYIPENSNFLDYWTRVEDRLFKIRQSLNILGIKQALPLFQPPIDPMALVNAMASGGGLAAALAAGQMQVPHYRFTFMIEQAKQLADKVNQFGNDLLSNLEKRDGEELSIMQSRQEGEILDLTIKVNEAQIEEAQFNLLSAEESLVEAQARKEHYEDLIDEGLLTHEEAQIGLMIASNVLNVASGILKIGSALAYAFPKVDIGPFKMGIQVGGDMVANGLDKISEAIQGVAQVTSLTGEIIGVFANHERMKQDWRLQLKTAESNIRQFEHQIEAAKIQKAMAEYQLDILNKQIDHNKEVADFYRSKFTNQQLYSWMVSQLSAIYYQTYKNAFDLAKSAEKAYQFERGIKPSQATFIGSGYWDSQRKGLLAGDKLNADIQKMEKSFYQTNKRNFEIKKDVSLFDLDPIALVKLKQTRTCEFSLTEALYNYDFQGHYRRQIKSIAVSFQAGDEDLSSANATLTQLSSKIIMEPDIKAVKYLLDPQGAMPESIRGNWRQNQQIALSRGYEDSGMFEFRFDEDRYLPFEGTGAVSDWRLSLSGMREDYDIREITDVIITVNYTAEQGGELFGSEVKSTLKPYLAAQKIDVANGFPDAWQAFLGDEEDELELDLHPSMFPNIRGNKITGILCKYELFQPGSVGMMLKEQDGQELTDGKLMVTDGLKLPKDGATWTFTLNGDKDNVKDIELIFTYQAALS
jgi:hypothetical protein